MRRLYPERLFFGATIVGVLTGFAMSISGVSSTWGYRLVMGFFLLAWMPAIVVMLFMWRDNRRPPTRPPHC